MLSNIWDRYTDFFSKYGIYIVLLIVVRSIYISYRQYKTLEVKEDKEKYIWKAVLTFVGTLLLVAIVTFFIIML